MRISNLLAAALIGLSSATYSEELPVNSIAKNDAQALVDFMLPFAETMLSKHGGFFPYGAQQTVSGAIEAVGASDGSEHPPSQELLALLRGGLAQAAKKGTIRCSGVAYDAKVIPPGASNKSDAVIIELEHKDGYHVVVVFPYTLSGGQLEFGQTFAMAGTSNVFP